MHRFLLRFFIGFIVSVALLAGFHGWFEYKLRPRWVQEQRFVQIEASDYNPATVILGDSHTAYGLYFQTEADSIFNFSAPGDELTDLYLKARWIVKNKPSVRKAVVQLDPNNFFTADGPAFASSNALYLRHTTEADFIEVFAPTRMNLFNAHAVALLPLTDQENRTALRTTFLRAADTWLTGDNNPGETGFDRFRNLYWPYGSASLIGKDSVALAAEARIKVIDYHSFHMGFRQENADLLIKLVKTLRAAGITVTGLRMPLTQAYRAAAQPFIPALYDSTLAQAGFSEILDFSSWSKDTALFADVSHLNESGARLFTPVFLHTLSEADKRTGSLSK